jgi:DNA recombination protein RmuC
MEIAYLFTGLILGAVLSYLFFKNKFSNNTGVSTEEFNRVDREKERLQTQVNFISEERDKISAELMQEREKLLAANNRLAKAEEAFKNQNEKLANQKAEIEELQKKFTLEFENIANKIFEEKGKKFTEFNKNQLDVILNPLNEKIKDFGEKVEKIYKSESEERITLKTEIKHLVELNKQISQEANNLALALKGDNKKQGNWGEVMLEQLLERSGLEKGREYDTQITSTNTSGEIIKPDVIVYLPDKKHVIIDSKVSLLAYDAFVNAEDDETRLKYQKEHLASVKNHIKTLSEKDYHTSKDFDSPEFILMFIPIESSFSTAVQAADDLFNYAWERKIVLVSPSTLFATLRTIASMWKQERQKNNVLKIADIGGKMYDQFVSFVKDMNDLSRNLQKAQESYENAYKRLSTGNGNLIKRAEEMKALGAKASKNLDQNILDEANENLLEEK